MNLPVYVKKTIERLEENGFCAYAVGGCVRDSILEKKPHDYDITTSATPEQILKCFSESRCIKTGMKHGTVGVLTDGGIVEITTYRVDGEYTDNRHPKNVSFTGSLKEDLARRDFTVNAMAYNETSGVVDYFGGKEDLENKIIRCVGDAEIRFEEDALRIIRALRFSAVLGFEIEEKTKAAVFEKRKLLLNISSERIRDEFSKLILAPFAEMVIRKYIKVIAVFLPELAKTRGICQFNEAHIYDVFMHTLKAVSYSEAIIEIRLGMLFHDLGKPYCFSVDTSGKGHFYGHQKIGANIAKDALTRLRYDNKTIQTVYVLVNYHDGRISANEKSVLRWLRRLGEKNLRLLLMVKRADSLAHEESYAKKRIHEIGEIEKTLEIVLENKMCYSLKTLEYNGNNAAAVGFAGKEIGMVLDYLLTAVIEGRCPNKFEKLDALARRYHKRQTKNNK